MYSIKIHEFIKNMDMEVVYISKNTDAMTISGIEINRPGLQLAGFYKHFVPERIQILGEQEKEYLLSLDMSLRKERLENLFKHDISSFIIANDIPDSFEIEELAKKYKVILLKTKLPTTRFISKLILYLEDMLAPTVTLHGVLLEVFGLGVMLTGKSGVGKSEAALELIKSGHRLVADDAVEIKQIESMLRGSSPEIIRHFMEIRGLGILDIERLYGVGAVKTWEMIDLVIDLEHWEEQKEYDRIGMDEETIEILGIDIPRLVVPVQPGRNVAMIVEVAARNTRQKQFGYNAAEELDNKIKEKMKEKKEYLGRG